jgi:hypothetical protein
MKTHGLRVVGPFLLALLGLLALAGTSAQAETGANWMVNGANINATLLPSVQIKEVEKLPGTELRHLVLLTTILKINVEILCTGMTLVNSELKAGGSSLGKGRFTGCVVFLNGTESASCLPHTEAEAGGVLQTRLLKDLIVLHEPSPGVKSTLDRIEPEEGNIIMTLTESEACPIGEQIPLRGKFYAEDCNAEFQIERLTHLFIQGPLTELWVTSVNNAEHRANVDGSVVAELSGAHAGLTWSALPG